MTPVIPPLSLLTTLTMAKLMVYGANGYTGDLISKQARHIGLDLVLAGRTESSLQHSASALNACYRVFDLDDPKSIDSGLAGIKVLLNCAGPFVRTAEPLIEGCIRNGVHYLDTSAELISYETAERNDGNAKATNVTLLPGCGGSVALLECLARRLLVMMGDHQAIDYMDLALHVSGPMSRGSAVTAKEGLATRILHKRNGNLLTQDATCTEQFDFDDGRGFVECFPVTLPDLITIPKFLGVQTLRTFANASGSAFSSGDLSTLPPGPTIEERDSNPYDAAVTLGTKDGSVERAVMHSVNGYSFTAMASVAAAKRMLQCEWPSGFQTSATLFGADFAESVLEMRPRAVIIPG